MQINITARDFGGTEFLAQPHRLHLGAQKAEGVDQLEFSLPEQWNGCVVTLHIRHADGTLAEPLALDEAGCVGVGRSFTGWASGEWMLAAANGNGYTAYTRPGQYDVHGILPTEGGGEELTPSVYEQFIARVVDSANAAAEAAKRAASGEANAKQSASEAAVSAQQTAASATLAAGYAEQAEAAADRAASYAPSEGAVLSVNGKSGAVRLNALDVWALPRPVSPKVGQLVRVVKVDASTGALTVDTISTDSLSGLGSEEKELLLKLLGSISYTDSSAKNALAALKKLWDTTPPTPLPDPDIIPVEKVTLSQHTLELSRGSTADLSASIAPPDATDQTVLWSVSPTDIVSVDAGRVTALKKGSAVVTATSDSKNDSCTVTVTPAVYRIETAHTDSGDIPAWDTYPAKSEFFMPLTAKKAGLLLRSLEFRVKGYMPGKMRTVLRKYGTTTALADKSIDLVRGYNDVVLDMGSIALEKGVEIALREDDKVVFEEFVDAQEVECAAIGNPDDPSTVSTTRPGEILAGAEFYTYDDKYKNGVSQTVIPAHLSEEKLDEVRAEARKAYLALGCSGLSRCDFFVERGTRRVLCNELNTLPGFTSISMYPKLMEHEGYSYPALVDKLLMLAVHRRKGAY